LKTNLGKITFDNGAPSIEQIIEASQQSIGLNLDYVVLGIQTYLVTFKGRSNWGAKLLIAKNFIQITDEGGMFEGPVVAEALLKIAKDLEGIAPENSKYIEFPLTNESLETYEAKYLSKRSFFPRILGNYIKGVLVLVILFVLYWFWK